MNDMDEQENYHSLPLWLNKSYMERILSINKKDEKLKILNLRVKPATSKGENYASVMIRLEVQFARSDPGKGSETEFYIVKTTYENDPYIANIFAGYEVSKTEMMMYEKVLPKLNGLLHEIDDPDKNKLFAKTLYVDYEHTAIIFEDLTVRHYELADRLLGLDLQHTHLAIRKLAKMHATSAVLNEREPNLLTKLQRGIFNRHTRGFGCVFENLVGVAAQFAGNCEQLGELYQDKLLKLQQNVVEYSTRVYDSSPEFFNTLNHGDFWVNNVMICYNENKEPINMALIDFQFCCWTTPAVDLHYFFNTSLQDELCSEQQGALIKYYHEELVTTLRALSFKGFVPSLRQMVLQLEAGRFYAVTSTLACQAILINDKTDDADANALLLDDERARNFRNLLYTNKRLQDNVKRLLPDFEQSGLLDVAD